MKKRIAMTAAVTMMLVAFASAPAFAGQWQSDATGWWWQNDDGSYPANCWQWLDGNQDGIAECYYFDATGYMLADTITPDGYQVDGNGAWIMNGAVQTQAAGGAGQQGQDAQGTDTQGQSQSGVYADDYSGIYSVPYYDVSGNVESYHEVTLTYDGASNSIVYSDPAAGYSATFTYFGAGLNGWTAFELVSTEEKSSIFFSAPGVMEAYGWDDFVSVQRK